jgi:hypothetical protein
MICLDERNVAHDTPKNLGDAVRFPVRVRRIFLRACADPKKDGDAVTRLTTQSSIDKIFCGETTACALVRALIDLAEVLLLPLCDRKRGAIDKTLAIP